MRSNHKRAWTYAIIATAILFFCTFSFAQNENIQGVYFKDGSTVYGKVVKTNVYEIQIETKDGKTVSRKFDDVDSFIKEGEGSAMTVAQASDQRGTATGTDRQNLARPDRTAGPDALLRPRHSFVVAPEISYIKYEEPGLMEETGMMYGISGSYAFHDRVMLKAEAKFAVGLLDYDGRTWGGTPLSISGIPNYMWEFRGLVGYDFNARPVVISPYLGLGYRWLQDNAQEKSASGYRRESNYFYIPIGVEALVVLGNGWSVGANVEYDVFVWGKQKSYLSDFSAGFSDAENDQSSGYGVRGSISIAKKGEKVGFMIEPYIKYWNIKESDVDRVTFYGTPRFVVEPDNNSTEIGCRFAVTF
jgi:hypothetical protein